MMNRINLVLLFAVLACALATVNSTHRARLLFADLEAEGGRQNQIELEWNQLQLEQSTWAKHALVEDIAVRQLSMHTPDTKRIAFVTPAAGTPAANPAGAGAPALPAASGTSAGATSAGAAPTPGSNGAANGTAAGTSAGTPRGAAQ